MKGMGKILIISLILIVITLLFIQNTQSLLNNIRTSYTKYVYLGGDDITIHINNKLNSEENTVSNASSGILTYIDYDNNTFGAIGHNIIEEETKIEGTVYQSNTIDIIKSNTSIGNKITTADTNKTYGSVEYADKTGIYGRYDGSFENRTPIQVAMPYEVKRGDAYIVTSINNEIKQYKIIITSINMFREDKNITFKVVDEELINQTGGIIKGMSGSPIIQNNKIVGALSHSYNHDFLRGNAIFITNMIK